MELHFYCFLFSYCRTDVCLSDGVSPVAKAKIIYYPAMELGEHKTYLRSIQKGPVKTIAV